MTENFQKGWGIRRRDLLKGATVAGGIGALGTCMASPVAGIETSSGVEFTLSQSEERKGCVTPLSYEEEGRVIPVDEFYNYNTNANRGGSNTLTNLENSEQSLLFFYEDANGVYLVFIHDDYNSTESTSRDEERYANFSFDTGLPSGGWVNIEQPREGGNGLGTNDFYSTTEAEWQWTPKWSDGGAYGPLSCDFIITIDEASFPQEGSDASWLATDGWTFLSGAADTPDGFTLDTSADVKLTCGCCTACDTSDELVGKFEWSDDATVEGDCEGFFTSYDTADQMVGSPSAISLTSVACDEDGEPMEACFSTEHCDLEAWVWAGGKAYRDTFEEGSLCVHKSDLGGHAISHVTFYCDRPDTYLPGNSGRSNRGAPDDAERGNDDVSAQGGALGRNDKAPRGSGENRASRRSK